MNCLHVVGLLLNVHFLYNDALLQAINNEYKTAISEYNKECELSLTGI